MKLLIISYLYTPDPYPRAFRWSAIAEHLVARGHEVTVLCASHPDRQADEVIGGVQVQRVGGGLLPRLRRTFYGDSSATNGRGPQSAGAARVHRPSLVKRVHDLTWKKLYWPDYACLWYFPAQRAARRTIATGEHDAVISVSVPFTGHLVGQAVKQRHPSLRWLVDIGDPFSFVEGAPPNNPRVYRRLNYETERRVLTNADAVAVTTEATRQEYARVFPPAAGKTVVIPPLLSVAAQEPDGLRFFRPDPERRRIVFAGTLYRSIRSPEFLLRVFSELVRRDASLELHLLGTLHGCEDLFAPYRRLLGTNLFLHGVVDRAAAQRALREADVLLNIGNDNVYQLPSKLVEYASAGKPVLNLVRSDRDSSYAFFESHPACFSLFTITDPAPEQMNDLLEFVRSARVAEPAALRRTLEPFRVEAIAGQYEDLLQCAF